MPQPGTDSTNNCSPEGSSSGACSHPGVASEAGGGPQGPGAGPGRDPAHTLLQACPQTPAPSSSLACLMLTPALVEPPGQDLADMLLPPCSLRTTMPCPGSLVVEDDVRPPDELRGDADGGHVLIVGRVPAQLVVMPLLHKGREGRVGMRGWKGEGQGLGQRGRAGQRVRGQRAGTPPTHLLHPHVGCHHLILLILGHK